MFKKGSKLTEEQKIKLRMYECYSTKPCAIHEYVRARKPRPDLCEFCNKVPPEELANIRNHNYTRNPDDYRWICRKCHDKLDGRGFKIGNKINLGRKRTEETKRKIRDGRLRHNQILNTSNQNV